MTRRLDGLSDVLVCVEQKVRAGLDGMICDIMRCRAAWKSEIGSIRCRDDMITDEVEI